MQSLLESAMQVLDQVEPLHLVQPTHCSDKVMLYWVIFFKVSLEVESQSLRNNQHRPLFHPSLQPHAQYARAQQDSLSLFPLLHQEVQQLPLVWAMLVHKEEVQLELE